METEGNSVGETVFLAGCNAPASLLLSPCEVQNSAPSGETVTCVMAAPRRGRKSRWFSWYFHWTRTDSTPPLRRLVPRQKKNKKQNYSQPQTKQISFLNKLVVCVCVSVCVLTFWGEAKRGDCVVVPVQGGVRVFLIMVKVSPKKKKQKQNTNKKIKFQGDSGPMLNVGKTKQKCLTKGGLFMSVWYSISMNSGEFRLKSDWTAHPQNIGKVQQNMIRW